VAFDFSSSAPAKSADPGPGVVRAWAVSKALDAKLAASESLPSPETTGAFQRFEADPSGLLPLHRHVAMSADKRIGVAVARLNVRAKKAGIRAFDLGFSDTAAVFLGGRPVSRLDASYSFDAPRREGLVGLDQARVYLPLREGDNEIAVLVSDRFGGWAIMGRFPDPEGLQVEAR
jgi:hypothetical protein